LDDKNHGALRGIWIFILLMGWYSVGEKTII